MDKETLDGILSAIRKDFYAMRNGMLADTLRKGGMEQKYIFGLQLPQIKDISVRFLPDNEDESAALAKILWSDKECREARLLACHLMPPALMTKEEAMEWAEGILTREEADILAFRLLRYLPFTRELANYLENSESELKKYAATAIRRFI